MRPILALCLLSVLGLSACEKPLGPDATPEQLATACDDGDLDACSRAAHLRSSAYEAAVKVISGPEGLP